MGSRGPAVSQLQVKLNSALVPSPRLATDGVFGPKTAQAVRLFQQRKGLLADGVVGQKTAAALGLVLGGGAGPVPGAPPGHSPPGRHNPPAPPPGTAPPAAGPPGFVDLSIFNVVIEAVIAGFQKIGAKILSFIDSDYVPQFVYDRVAGMVQGAINTVASPLRGIARQAVPLGQDPAAYVTGQIRAALARGISALSGALQPLLGLPVIGNVAAGYQRVLAAEMHGIDVVLNTLRNDGQSAQAAARRVAEVFEGIARRIV